MVNWLVGWFYLIRLVGWFCLIGLVGWFYLIGWLVRFYLSVWFDVVGLAISFDLIGWFGFIWLVGWSVWLYVVCCLGRGFCWCNRRASRLGVCFIFRRAINLPSRGAIWDYALFSLLFVVVVVVVGALKVRYCCNQCKYFVAYSCSTMRYDAVQCNGMECDETLWNLLSCAVPVRGLFPLPRSPQLFQLLSRPLAVFPFFFVGAATAVSHHSTIQQ